MRQALAFEEEIGVGQSVVTKRLGPGFVAGFAAALFLAQGPTSASADQVLRLASYSLPKALGNPHSSTSISEIYTWAAIFDNLTKVDATGRVLPSLALSWSARDPLTWRFQLREDVRFSNGEPFDAYAVATNIEYITSEAARRESVAREFRHVSGAKVVDTYTVDITTIQPVLVLPAKLAAFRMVAPRHWKALGPEGFGQDPVGTGPFKVVKWGTAKIELAAYEGSWRPPQVDQLEIYQLPDPSARLQGVQSGQLDIALILTPDDIQALESTGNSMHIGPGTSVTGMAFVTQKDSPIRDRRVRQALNYAVDKQAIVDALFLGHTRPAGQPGIRSANGHNPDVEPYPYDPDKARQLLAEAGYANGFDMVAEVVLSGSTNAVAVYSYVAQQLASVGVNLEVRGIPIAQLISKSITGDWAGTAFGMDFDVKPTLDIMRPIPMHSCQRIKPWHCDESVMPLIEAAQSEFDPVQRLKLLHELSRIYHDDPSMLYFYELVLFDGLSKRVRGFNPTNRIINYDEIRLVD
jgi:peptide/nickel transport system substrate-binding protein